MSRRIWMMGLVLALTGPSWGASEQYETATSPSEATTVLNLDALLGVSSGDKLPGVDIGIAARLGSSPIYLGAISAYLIMVPIPLIWSCRSSEASTISSGPKDRYTLSWA